MNFNNGSSGSNPSLQRAEPLIKLEGMAKVFLTDEIETHALSGVLLEIRKGEYVSIAGPSGCGKSTLLSILGLLDTPSDGAYVLNGHPAQGLTLAERSGRRWNLWWCCRQSEGQSCFQT